LFVIIFILISSSIEHGGHTGIKTSFTRYVVDPRKDEGVLARTFLLILQVLDAIKRMSAIALVELAPSRTPQIEARLGSGEGEVAKGPDRKVKGGPQ
jgi:hypothetical protein